MSRMRSEIDGDLRKLEGEFGKIRDCVPHKGRRVVNDEVHFKKLEKGVNGMKAVMDSKVRLSGC